MLNGTTNVLDNARHHVMVTRAGAELTLYVDGQKEASRADVAAVSATGTDAVYIGVLNSSLNYPFSGSIDELRVYNRALSTGEAYELYASAQSLYLTGECNDMTGGIHPGVYEICDGLDQNCDGVIDNGVQTIYYQDTDNDGYGSGLVTTGACAIAPTGYVAVANDCTDTDARLHPATIRYADADSDGFST